MTLCSPAKIGLRLFSRCRALSSTSRKCDRRGTSAVKIGVVGSRGCRFACSAPRMILASRRRLLADTMPGCTMKPFARTLAAGMALAGILAPLTAARATEGGASLYVPGVGVPTSGVLPPLGVYFDDPAYFYKADIGRAGRGLDSAAISSPTSRSISWPISSRACGSRRSRSSAATSPSGSRFRSASRACAPASSRRPDHQPVARSPIGARRTRPRPQLRRPGRDRSRRVAFRELALESRRGGEYPGRRL